MSHACETGAVDKNGARGSRYTVRMRITLPFLVVALFVAGCGHKGPLYLPKPKPAVQQPAPAAPAHTDAAKPGDGAPKQ